MTTSQRNIILAIAAAVLIGVGFFAGRSFRTSNDNASVSDNRDVATADTNPIGETPAASAPKTFFELRREYDELRKTPSGVQWDFIEKAEAYAKKTKVKSGGPDFSSFFRQSCRKQKL